jgi:phosphate transport system substrate-binding protein
VAPTRGQRAVCSLKLLAILAVFAVVGAAVNLLGDGADAEATASGDGDAGGAAAGELAGVEGEFLVSGSSTVFPIVQRQAEEFKELAPGVAIAVEGPGSGDGAKKFCAGEVPIANASRPFKDEEIAICEENGIEFIELRRGIDGITVITSVDNDLVACVSFNDLYALLSSDASQTDSWADANELTQTWGGQEFPDVKLDVFGPGEESGTFDSFSEIVIESVAKGKTGLDTDSREFVDTIRPDYTSSPDDNVVVEGIEASQYSLGWVGFAYASESAEAGRASLLAVSKEDGGECVTPTAESIASAEFPIARFLYTYVNAEAAESQSGVAPFVDYMLSDDGLESVSASGYIDLPSEEIAKTLATWTDRLTGRQYE